MVASLGEKVSKYGVFSGPYFPVFGKVRTRKNFVFGQFSHSASFKEMAISIHHRLRKIMFFMHQKYGLFVGYGNMETA